MANPVVHFEVTGKDGPALVSFYEELFGWKVNAIEGMGYALVEKEGDGIGGGIGTSQDGSSKRHVLRGSKRSAGGARQG